MASNITNSPRITSNNSRMIQPSTSSAGFATDGGASVMRFPKDVFTLGNDVSTFFINETMQCKSRLLKRDYVIVQTQKGCLEKTPSTLCVRSLGRDGAYSYTIYSISVPQYEGQVPIAIGDLQAYPQAQLARLPNSQDYGVFATGPADQQQFVNGRGHQMCFPTYIIQSTKTNMLLSFLRGRSKGNKPIEERIIYFNRGGITMDTQHNDLVATVTTRQSSRNEPKMHSLTTTGNAGAKDQQFWMSVCAACDEMDKDDVFDRL